MKSMIRNQMYLTLLFLTLQSNAEQPDDVSKNLYPTVNHLMVTSVPFGNYGFTSPPNVSAMAYTGKIDPVASIMSKLPLDKSIKKQIESAMKSNLSRLGLTVIDSSSESYLQEQVREKVGVGSAEAILAEPATRLIDGGLAVLFGGIINSLQPNTPPGLAYEGVIVPTNSLNQEHPALTVFGCYGVIKKERKGYYLTLRRCGMSLSEKQSSDWSTSGHRDWPSTLKYDVMAEGRNTRGRVVFSPKQWSTFVTIDTRK